MNKIKLALTSRTVWTIIALFVINGITAIHSFIPTNILNIIDPILGLMAVYFKVNPSQSYTA